MPKEGRFKDRSVITPENKPAQEVVIGIKAKGVELSETSKTLKKGETFTLYANVSPKNAYNRQVMWSSDKPEVATVDADGKVDARSFGEALITATTQDGNHTATCRVTVEQPVTGVALNKSEHTLKVGETVTLTATVVPSDATNQIVTWSSDKPEIAKVDEKGTIEALKEGIAVITVMAKDGGHTATCKVTVSPASQDDTPVDTHTLHLALFPNPATTQIAIAGLEAEAHAVIANSLGTTVLSVHVSPAQHIDISTLPAGVYLLRVDGVTLRFVKQ